MVRTHPRCWAVALAASTFLALPASAQDATEEDATARARELFGQGVDAGDAGDWDLAATRFREALEQRDAPAIRVNLAMALVELDRLGEAYEAAERVADDEAAPEAQRAQAQELVTQLAERVARVRVELAGDTEGVSVSLGMRELAPEEVGRAVAVNPGPQALVAYRDGAEVGRQDVDALRGEVTEARMVIVPRPAEVPLEEAPVEEAPATGGEPITQKKWFWPVVGGAAAAVVLVAIIAATAGGGTQSPVQGNLDPGVLEWN